jgi:hypothetical protein
VRQPAAHEGRSEHLSRHSQTRHRGWRAKPKQLPPREPQPHDPR